MTNHDSQVNFQDLFVNLLSKLSEREQEVLKNRYHLTSNLDKKATLKQIGDTYNITRERVRQIEKEAVRKFVEHAKAEEFAIPLKQIEQAYITFLEQKGGLVREDHLLEDFVNKNHNFDELHTNAFLFALEHFFGSTHKVENHDALYSAWKLQNVELETIVQLITQLEQILEQEKKLYGQTEMLELAKASLTEELKTLLNDYTFKHGLDLENFLESYLQTTSKIEKNILGEWGLANWDTIKPKKLGDKIKLVFQKVKKPLHFRDIAENIGNAKFDHKKICAATVHNELIANDGFVLIGRGLYALKDWGYSTGTVAEIIKQVLEQAGGPMTKEDIYNKVLEQRQVNKSTIYLTLINRDRFTKTSDGKFDTLK